MSAPSEAELHYDEYIDSVVAKAPPLTPAQITRLSALFDVEAPETRPRPPRESIY